MAAGKVAGPELDIHRLYMAQKNKMEFCLSARQKASDSNLQTGGGGTTVWNQHILRNVPTKPALQQGINRLNSSAFGRLRPSPLGGGTRAARPLGTSRSMSAASRGKRFHQLQDFLLGEDFFQDDDELALTCMKLHEVVVVGTASKMSPRDATKPEEKPQQNVVSTTSVYPVQLPAIERQKSLIEPAVQEEATAKRATSRTAKHLSNKLARRQARKTSSSRAWEQPRPKSVCSETESSNSDLDLDSNSAPESQPQKIERVTDVPRPRSVGFVKPRGDPQCTDDASTEVLTTTKSLSARTNRVTPPVLKLSPLTYFEVDRNNLFISDTLSTPQGVAHRQPAFPNRTRRVSEPVISVAAPPEPRAESPRKSIIRSRSTDASCDSSSESDGGRPETKRCARTVRFMGMEVKIYAPDAPVIEISHKG
ncbi:hypothetical protein Bbelb_088310 [Branchiostoma belcheri]|nr:hypothetical protein Bbelb_088310 [Branchiostoma belcheri]